MKQIVCLAVLTGIGLGMAAWAGPIEPPVPPGTPTMKPLDELEPRRPIMADMLPLTITDEGSSWYLAESITTTGGGITIQAFGVTIDLMGHVLRGGTGPGIMAAPYNGLTVRNGTLLAWSGSCLIAGNRAHIERVLVSGCLGSGIRAGYDSMVLNSHANASAVHGIIVWAGSIVEGCVAVNNTGNGIWAETDLGLVGALVTGCVIDGNFKNGVRVDGYSTVIDNQIRGNRGPGKAGIWVQGDHNRIERNTILQNVNGLDVDGDYNLIARNMVGDSQVSNFDISPTATGNLIIIHSISSGTPPDPWANIETP